MAIRVGQAVSVGMTVLDLPRPRLQTTRTVGEALWLRTTTREISQRELEPQMLSDLLFAACGVNRATGPFEQLGITSASASNSQEIDVYLALRDGVFLFDRRVHGLRAVLPKDVRQLAYGPHQRSVSPRAPVQLIYVVDLDRLEYTRGFEEPGLHDPEVQKSYYFVDTGLIAGNVYLFAAAEGLACWFHNCDRERLSRELALGPRHRVLFAQTVGYARHSTRLTK